MTLASCQSDRGQYWGLVLVHDFGDFFGTQRSIGNTPLVRLHRVAAHVLPVEVYAKAEWYNPSGSVKDRPAREIILAAERAGLLTPEKTLLDATSGNMGIAYAMLCAARGYRVKLVIPKSARTPLLERERMVTTTLPIRAIISSGLAKWSAAGSAY